MKKICFATILAFLTGFTNSGYAQRAIGARTLVLDDGGTPDHTVTITVPPLAASYTWTLPTTAPGGGSCTQIVPCGSVTGSTLYWNGTNWLENTSVLSRPSSVYPISLISAAGNSPGNNIGVLGTTVAASPNAGAGVYGANVSTGFLATVPAPGIEGLTETSGVGIYALSSGAGSGPAFSAGVLFGSTADAGDFYGNVSITGNLNVTGTGHIISSSSIGTVSSTIVTSPSAVGSDVAGVITFTDESTEQVATSQ